MQVTKRMVADKLAAYLRHQITLAELVDWAERTLMEAEFSEADAATLSSALARLGVADVRAFGLSWEDCEQLLGSMGYTARVQVVAA